MNSIFVAINELFLDFKQRLPLFFFYDIIRFSTLFSMSFLYASIVTKNLLPQRKQIINGLRVFFWFTICVMAVLGLTLSRKLQASTSYARILCTDPILLYLRVGPFLSSIFFAIIIKQIKNRVVEGPDYLKIDEARKYKRLKTLKRLQIINFLFIFVSLFLITWDLIRLLQNLGLPSSEVNCFGVSSLPLLNDTLWFLARFFAS